VELDLDNRRALVDGEEVSLTPTEFDLAACMFSNAGKLLSRQFLLHEVWGVSAELDTRTVDMHMSRVRKLLKIGPNMGYCIKTVYRHGYRLESL
jgi:DNA-binding response OmpR family regulator